MNLYHLMGLLVVIAGIIMGVTSFKESNTHSEFRNEIVLALLLGAVGFALMSL